MNFSVFMCFFVHQPWCKKGLVALGAFHWRRHKMVAGKLGVTLTGPKGTQAVFPMNFMGWVDSHSYFTSVLWGSFCLAALWEMEKKTLLVPKCANLDRPSRTCIPQGLVSYQESKKRNKAREARSPPARMSVPDPMLGMETTKKWWTKLQNCYHLCC